MSEINMKERGKRMVIKMFPVYTREILIAIGVISVLLTIQAITWEKPVEVQELSRPSFMEGDNEVKLYYDYIEIGGEPIVLDLPALDIEKSKIQSLLEKRSEEVTEYIVGGFDEEQMIDNRLVLDTKHKECLITYKFYPQELVTSEGWLLIEAFKEEEEIIIGFELEIMDEERNKYTQSDSVLITINKKQFTDEYKIAYSKYLLNLYQEAINESDEEIFSLPKEFIFYNKKPTGVLLYMSGIMISVIIFLIMISNLENAVNMLDDKGRRKNNLTYFINNFLILYRTGMTITKSFQYALSNRIQALDEKDLMYEELNKLQNYLTGNPNLIDCLNQFVQIFDCTDAYRFKRLLLQNQKQGDDQLVNQLEYMTGSMWDKRIRTARKEGERASSKLVFPMLLIFIVILILTIVPSFMEVESLL